MKFSYLQKVIFPFLNLSSSFSLLKSIFGYFIFLRFFSLFLFEESKSIDYTSYICSYLVIFFLYSFPFIQYLNHTFLSLFLFLRFIDALDDKDLFLKNIFSADIFSNYFFYISILTTIFSYPYLFSEFFISNFATIVLCFCSISLISSNHVDHEKNQSFLNQFFSIEKIIFGLGQYSEKKYISYVVKPLSAFFKGLSLIAEQIYPIFSRYLSFKAYFIFSIYFSTQAIQTQTINLINKQNLLKKNSFYLEQSNSDSKNKLILSDETYIFAKFIFGFVAIFYIPLYRAMYLAPDAYNLSIGSIFHTWGKMLLSIVYTLLGYPVNESFSLSKFISLDADYLKLEETNAFNQLSILQFLNFSSLVIDFIKNFNFFMQKNELKNERNTHLSTQESYKIKDTPPRVIFFFSFCSIIFSFVYLDYFNVFVNTYKAYQPTDLLSFFHYIILSFKESISQLSTFNKLIYVLDFSILLFLFSSFFTNSSLYLFFNFISSFVFISLLPSLNSFF